MFTFETDREKLFLKITLTCYWGSEIFARFEAAARAAVASLEPLGGCRAMLIDATDYPVQSQEVAAGHRNILATTRRTRPTRIAVVTASALQAIQSRRLSEFGEVEIFHSEAQAHDWLFAAPAA